MKVKFRRSCNDDLENIYNLHIKCFSSSDHWYRSHIKNFLNNGIVIESNNNIIGVCLQGTITPCTRITGSLFSDFNMNDTFEPTNDNGKEFLENEIHYKDLHGIVMICVDPSYRGKGLAKKLIEKHLIDNKDKMVCLNTRRSNISAYSLYKKMGYIQVAFIKNKYFHPTEDSIFMIYDPIAKK